MELRKVENPKEIYDAMEKLSFPYHYEAGFETWEKSYLYDIDGEGRTLFSELTTIGAYGEEGLAGYIQYGNTAFGFDKDGAIRDTISVPVIRSFYFDKEQEEAVKALSNGADRIYAFFHYFGMSCYARHGKLFEGFTHVHKLLEKNGFDIEHKNVFYSAVLMDEKCTAVKLKWHDMTPGRQQYCDFILDNEVVGGCEVHFLEQKGIAYLRWIFTRENKCGQGIGSKSMTALKADLFQRGIVRFDTDTALTNQVAQRFYEKNHFVREGLTRSYYKTVS